MVGGRGCIVGMVVGVGTEPAKHASRASVTRGPVNLSDCYICARNESCSIVAAPTLTSTVSPPAHQGHKRGWSDPLAEKEQKEAKK